MAEPAFLRATVVFKVLSDAMDLFLERRMPGAHPAGDSWFDAVEPEFRSPRPLSRRDPYFQLKVIRKFAQKLFDEEKNDVAQDHAAVLLTYRNRWAHYEDLSPADVDDLYQRVLEMCAFAGDDVHERLSGISGGIHALDFPDPGGLAGRRRRKAKDRIDSMRRDEAARQDGLLAAASTLQQMGPLPTRAEVERLVSRVGSGSDTGWMRDFGGLLAWDGSHLVLHRALLPLTLAAHGCRQPAASQGSVVPRAKAHFALAFTQGRDDAQRTLDIALAYVVALIVSLDRLRQPRSVSWAIQQCRLAGVRAAGGLLPWFGNLSGAVAGFSEDLGEYVAAIFTDDEPAADEVRTSLLGASAVEPMVCAEALLWWSTKLHQYLALVGPADVTRGVAPEFSRQAARSAREVASRFSTNAVDPVSGWPSYPITSNVREADVVAFFTALHLPTPELRGLASNVALDGPSALPDDPGALAVFDIVLDPLDRLEQAKSADGVDIETIDVWTALKHLWALLSVGTKDEGGAEREIALALAEAGATASRAFTQSACELLWAFCDDLVEDSVSSSRHLASIVEAAATVQTTAESDHFGEALVSALVLSASDGSDERIHELLDRVEDLVREDPGRVRRLLLIWAAATDSLLQFCRQRMPAGAVAPRSGAAIAHFENHWALLGTPPPHLFRRTLGRSR